MGMHKEKTCGECIHADICKEVNGGWFSPKNIAYCKGFKDSTNFVGVVRCKDCKNYGGVAFGDVCRRWSAPLAGMKNCTRPNDFCSYGERKDNEH